MTSNNQPRPRTARELRKMKQAEERKRKAQERQKTAAQDAGPEETTEPVVGTEGNGTLHRDPEPEPTPLEEPSPAEAPPGETDHEEDRATAGSIAGGEEEWRQEAEKWKREAEENQELVLRARADFENLRRRAKKDQEETAKYAAASLAESLLPVLDNLERALAAGEESGETDALRQGVDMVYRQLLQVLSDKGLSVIEAEGREFNPHEHTAVMEEEVAGVEPGMVVQELQKGYRFKDRVLRPSMVKVSS
ncbi:nucleotide exchange factor GrpE [Salinithrix halophila]|uniref:nucleotide exchange factor GrpE n=1 Tax=Salinithrix halophila TaxID=1485204 RepID=UPI0036D213FA